MIKNRVDWRDENVSSKTEMQELWVQMDPQSRKPQEMPKMWSLYRKSGGTFG
jgi:hypothetical protein